MGKLSLYKPGKSKDYRFIDRICSQSFNIAGTLIHVHKYLGPVSSNGGNSGDETNELTIQDVLLLENRDRKYEDDVIDLKAHYSISDLDYNLTQFGILINTNILFMNFHINDMIDRLGRKIMSGDVLEIEHRKEDVVLDPSIPSINAFYVVKDASRAADGYAPTWLPHIWRIRAEPLTDSPEYKEILDKIKDDTGQSIGDIISNGDKYLEINKIIQEQAAKDVPTRNFNSANLYVEPAGSKPLKTNNLQGWPLNGDGIPPNQDLIAPKGTRFPQNPMPGDYFLRTDYNPPRLFQRHDNKWCLVEIAWRDREWTPAHRSLEDHLEDKTVTTLVTDPANPFLERQSISNPIKSKKDLPDTSNDTMNDGEE